MPPQALVLFPCAAVDARLCLIRFAQEAEESDRRISVAIVDSSSGLILCQRDDGVIGLRPAVALGKACTAPFLNAPAELFGRFINEGMTAFSLLLGDRS
ncbi:heme-binding protein [Pseudomonas aeruginosa]|uniref:heme-binding protein n=1 Tax=Pseudomonas aeruginosa TaxID=287 RepID=UPI003593934C